MPDLYAPHKSAASILAILSAIGSFWVHSGVLGIVLAVLAILFGLLGALLSLAPGMRGGILSILAIFLGLIGIAVGVLRTLYHVGRHL